MYPGRVERWRKYMIRWVITSGSSVKQACNACGNWSSDYRSLEISFSVTCNCRFGKVWKILQLSSSTYRLNWKTLKAWEIEFWYQGDPRRTMPGRVGPKGICWNDQNMFLFIVTVMENDENACGNRAPLNLGRFSTSLDALTWSNILMTCSNILVSTFHTSRISTHLTNSKPTLPKSQIQTWSLPI